VKQTYIWVGAPGTFRVEIAHVEQAGDGLHAHGTQIGIEDVAYELRYELDRDRLAVEVVGGKSIDVAVDGADFFDLGYSPLFNSLPVLRHEMHRGGQPRDFIMAWVSVPDLEVLRSEQRYDPLRGGLVRFSSGSFSADIEFDDDGMVVHYPQLADRVYPEVD
jgi:uncharacterized protein